MMMNVLMPRNLLAGLSALIVAGALQPAAEAGGKESLLFAQGSSIWRMDIEGKGKPVELVQIGQGTVTRIHASDEGDTLLIEKDDEVLWARPGRGSKPVPARPLDCKPHAHLAADGKHAACMDQSGNRVLIRLDPGPRKTVYGAAINTHIGFGGKTMISSDDKGVWAAPPGRSQSGRALLAREPPQSHLLVAPSGKRAVGVYLEAQGHGLYTFRLDGKGVRRRLMKGATPVAWSRDSRWLLVQADKSACMVRAAGGQYKCWRRYQAVDISPDGSHVLLVKENDDDEGKRKRKGKSKRKRKRKETSRDNGASSGEFGLYRGGRDGIKPDAPTLVRSQVHPAAAWLGK
jgi:hypothetical protein